MRGICWERGWTAKNVVMSVIAGRRCGLGTTAGRFEPDLSQQSIDSDASLIVPGGAWFLSADFARVGGDLVLSDAEGHRHILENYFESAAPADLVNEGGAVISGALATRLAGHVAPGQYAQATPVAPAEAAEAIGR